MISFVSKTVKMVNENQLISGILLGWFFTQMMNMFKRPTLIFAISDDKEFIKGNRKFKFLNIVIKNKNQNFLKKFLFGNVSLNNSRVWLRFLDYQSKAEMLKINARWTSTKEPVDYQSGKPILSDILIPSRESIPSGEEAGVSVAIKEAGINSFYAFNNESYLHNWKKPDYQLDDRKYIIEINILSDGNEYSHQFTLVNPPNSLSFFKLLDE